jgi:hypothetical protein
MFIPSLSPFGSKTSVILARSQGNKHPTKPTNIKSVKRYVYFLQYYFSFLETRYPLGLLIKGLNIHNVLSFSPTSIHSKQEMSSPASSELKCKQ